MVPHRPSRWAQDEGINLTPLLDVIFNLIFFFAVATTLRQDAALNINLPQSSESEQVASEKRALVVSFSQDGQFAVDGAPVSLEELEQTLARLKSPDVAGVVIRGDGAGDYQSFIHVLTACQKAGLATGQLDVQNAPRLNREPK